MATASADALNIRYAERLIDRSLIDPPALAVRETMDERELAELAMNIQIEGLLQPIVVKPVNDRFEIIAGNRRWLACEIIDFTPVPCRVRIDGSDDTLSALIAENAYREDVNPVEEALFYERVLLEKCEGDTDRLAATVRRSRDFVEDRLELLSGSPRVLEALRAKQISIAVARQLNKEPDPNRLLTFLDLAIQMGATARQVMEWRKQAASNAAIVVSSAEEDAAAAAAVPLVAIPQTECFYCESTEHPHMMQTVSIHAPCLGIVNKILGRVPVPAGQGGN